MFCFNVLVWSDGTHVKHRWCENISYNEERKIDVLNSSIVTDNLGNGREQAVLKMTGTSRLKGLTRTQAYQFIV